MRSVRLTGSWRPVRAEERWSWSTSAEVARDDRFGDQHRRLDRGRRGAVGGVHEGLRAARRRAGTAELRGDYAALGDAATVAAETDSAASAVVNPRLERVLTRQH